LSAKTHCNFLLLAQSSPFAHVLSLRIIINYPKSTFSTFFFLVHTFLFLSPIIFQHVFTLQFEESLRHRRYEFLVGSFYYLYLCPYIALLSICFPATLQPGQAYFQNRFWWCYLAGYPPFWDFLVGEAEAVFDLPCCLFSCLSYLHPPLQTRTISYVTFPKFVIQLTS
jgi:hypothetical protein